MCNFISWKECQGKYYFLTNDVVALKLEEFKKYNAGWKNDLVGHGAIEWFFNLPHGCGKNFECEDFSTPSNFPSVIVEAIKAGKMSFGPLPDLLLSESQQKNYYAKRKSLYDDYYAKCKSLDDDYYAKRKPLDDDYYAKRIPLDDDYNAKRKSLYDDYYAKCKSLDDDLWKKFQNPRNRNKNWR